MGMQIERECSNSMKRYNGFMSTDEIILSAFCSLVGGKLESFLSDDQLKLSFAKTFEIPKVIVQILHSRSIAELVKISNTSLPYSINYEYGEILFYNSKCKFSFNHFS